MIEIPDSFYIALGLGVVGGVISPHLCPLVDFVFDYVGGYRRVSRLARGVRKTAEGPRRSGPSELEE